MNEFTAMAREALGLALDALETLNLALQAMDREQRMRSIQEREAASFFGSKAPEKPGIPEPVEPPNPPVIRRRWTAEEDDYLMQWYGKHSITSLAAALDRTPSAIYNRIHLLTSS